MEATDVNNNDVVHPEVRAHINSLVSAVSPQVPLFFVSSSCLTDPPLSSVDGASTTTATNSATTPSKSCAT